MTKMLMCPGSPMALIVCCLSGCTICNWSVTMLRYIGHIANVVQKMFLYWIQEFLPFECVSIHFVPELDQSIFYLPTLVKHSQFDIIWSEIQGSWQIFSAKTSSIQFFNSLTLHTSIRFIKILSTNSCQTLSILHDLI